MAPIWSAVRWRQTPKPLVTQRDITPGGRCWNYNPDTISLLSNHLKVICQLVEIHWDLIFKYVAVVTTILCWYFSHRCSLQWRHNDRDGLLNHRPPWLFTQPFAQAHIKENTKTPRHCMAFVRRIHRWSADSPHKGPVTRKCFHLMTSSWPSVSFCLISNVPLPTQNPSSWWRRVMKALFGHG